MALRVYNWPSARGNEQSIALSQSVTIVANPVSLVLNGVYSNGPCYNQNIPGQYLMVSQSLSSNVVYQVQDAPVQYSVPFPDFFRNIRISSSNDLSTLTFHVSGTYAGQPLREDIAGPNATFADGVNFYDSILSITVSGPPGTYNDINVGIGLIGGTGWFAFDWKQPISATSIQVIVQSNTINYSFGVTLQDVTTTPYASLLLPDPTGALTNQAVSGFNNTSILPFKYAGISITQGGGGTDDTGSLQAFLLQAGI